MKDTITEARLGRSCACCGKPLPDYGPCTRPGCEAAGTCEPTGLKEQLEEAQAAVPCDHHWVWRVRAGQSLRMCSICHDPNWDELARERQVLRNLVAAIHGDFFAPANPLAEAIELSGYDPNWRQAEHV